MIYKYIVYKTTNKINNKIYIGVHKTKDADKFDGYIGCGIYINQPYTYKYPKTKFQWAVVKYGTENFIRETLEVFNTSEEAYLLESKLVNEEFLERDDVYNMVLGGESGCLQSQKQKVYQYDCSGNYVAEYKSYADAAGVLDCDYTLISYAVRKKFKAKNYFWTSEKMDALNLEEFNLGDNHAVKVYCYNSTGEFFKEFKTQAAASKELNISPSAIKNGRLRGTLVYNTYYFCSIKQDTFKEAFNIYITSRPVYLYNKLGELIEEFSSQFEAEIKYPDSNITKILNTNKRDSNDNLWRDIKCSNCLNINKRKEVGKYTLNGDLVYKYKSATEAANIEGTSVWKVLSGTNQTHKGYIYKYIS